MTTVTRVQTFQFPDYEKIQTAIESNSEFKSLIEESQDPESILCSIDFHALGEELSRLFADKIYLPQDIDREIHAELGQFAAPIQNHLALIFSRIIQQQIVTAGR